jgi:hypothetical protein
MADRDQTTTGASTTDSAPELEAASRAYDAGGFAAVARRISGWTANLLASGIVIVACLAIGRQTIAWWYESPVDVTAKSPAASLPESLPQELQLMTRHGSLTMEQIRGDREMALVAMRKRCTQEAAESDLHSPDQSSRTAPLREEEERFLARLANSAPIEQTSGIDLYQPQGELTMVVAVSRKPRRIAAWSFAIPAEEAVWSCYTVRPGDLPLGK